MSSPLLSQAAALLTKVLTQELAVPCSLEAIEQSAHRHAQEISRLAVSQVAQQSIAQAEAQLPPCACGDTGVAEQRCWRALLVLPGLIRVRLRRYRCPTCGAWQSPGAAALELRPKQRMTRTVEGLLAEYGTAWSFAVGAVRIARVLPGLLVSAKTVERCVKRCAQVVAAQEDAAAEAASQDERTVEVTGPAFQQPDRVYVTFDGILVRGRKAKQRLEIQVASLFRAWRELAGRRHPRREITDRSIVARAQGWEALGRQVWRVFVQRGGAGRPQTQVVASGEGASGIRSVRELHFAEALAILDPWHLWEKVKERSREVLGKGERAWTACQEVWQALKKGAVDLALRQVRAWPAATEWAEARRERLVGYLERNRDQIPNYEQLRQEGYLVGGGLMEKQNDLVVVPRMKNGKMHWSPAGANWVALLRAYVLSHPDTPLLPM